MAVLLRPLFCIVLAFSRTDGARAAATCTVHHPYDRVVHSFREKSSQGSSYLGCSAMELNNFVHRVFGTAQAHALRPQWNERGRPGCPELFRMEPSFRASFHDASPEDRPSSSANSSAATCDIEASALNVSSRILIARRHRSDFWRSDTTRAKAFGVSFMRREVAAAAAAAWLRVPPQ